MGMRESHSLTLTEASAFSSTGSALASRDNAACQKAQHRKRISNAPLWRTVDVQAFEPASSTHIAARLGGPRAAAETCVQPAYERPIVPILPLHHGWRAIHSMVS